MDTPENRRKWAEDRLEQLEKRRRRVLEVDDATVRLSEATDSWRIAKADLEEAQAHFNLCDEALDAAELDEEAAREFEHNWTEACEELMSAEATDGPLRAEGVSE